MSPAIDGRLELYTPEQIVAQRRFIEEGDNWVIHQQQGVVDLTEALLEAVVLDVPQHVVHPEHDELVSLSVGDDQEAEPSDDEAEEIDPRWDALRKLRDDANDDSGPVRN